MTREEAIKTLDAMWKMLTSAYDDIADSHVAAYTMAVDALKAQGTCEDAVSRQTLQKELALYPIDDVTSEDEAGYNRAINDVQKMVLHLPSAQPQLTMGQVNDTAQSTNDCISRQAAIELIERMKPYHQNADDIAEMIANMPSAQPERKTGKWMLTEPDAPCFYRCDRCGRLVDFEEHYCPSCGAYMKGEQNENR